MALVYLIRWTETEAGWGQRPDGVSIHRSEEEAKEYTRLYWEAEKERNPSGDVPHEYSFPEETGKWIKLDDNALIDRLQNSDHGVRIYQHEARIELEEPVHVATVTHEPYKRTVQSYRDKQIDKVIDTLEGRKGFYVLRDELGDDMIREIAGDIVDAI